MNGKTLRDAIISGTNNITNHKDEVDELNVFPVPDGDTGANMSATMKSTLSELSLIDDNADIGVVAEKAADAMLRGARGNSGVITSLLFRGLSKGLAGKATATTVEFCEALEKGVRAAYKSVMKPTEGTILTVARQASAAAAEIARNSESFTDVFDALASEAEKTLTNTPELLPVLKKAGVVDSGGKGYLYIVEGMRSVVNGNGIIAVADDSGLNAVVSAGLPNLDSFSEEEITFGYCTEYIVNKKPDAVDVSALRAYLESIGDSVVVVDDDEIIKVHVHTDNPGKAIEEGLLFGELNKVKIENMLEQHREETARKMVVADGNAGKLLTQPPENDYGFVAVASGEGVEALFYDLGVNHVVKGGQTFNPSTEDIMEAILATSAHNVFVLPNNKNIILAAEQAQKLVKDRNVIVLQSRTMPQGITALLTFNPNLDVKANSLEMTLAFDKVSTGIVTFASRDSDFENKKIKKNDILALENGKLAYVEKDVTKALIRITNRMVKSDSVFIMVMYGEDVSEENAQEAFRQLKAKISTNAEMVLVNGGQPVYYYIVSVE